MFPPWSAYVLTAFGILYGWLLHRAALSGVYRLTGLRGLDAYVLVWLLGLACGYTPMFLYLAFGFKEFARTPEGERQTIRLHWAGKAEAAFFVLYTIFILATVRQRTDNPITAQDLGQIIVTNIILAFIAILFTGLKSWYDQRK